MSILYFCPLWGLDQPLPAAIDTILAQGYDGVETLLPPETPPADVRHLMKQTGLQLIAQQVLVHTADFAEHQHQMTAELYRLAEYAPVKINSHTGKDFFSVEQNLTLLQTAHAISAEINIPVIHETHRSRFSYAAHVCKHYLEHDTDLSLTADFSHWCVVAESLLADQPDALALAIQRSRHIHARVGHAQGPQVTNPDHAVWQTATQQHFHWWDQIIAQGEPVTITPEFGPVPYMPLDDHQQPVTDATQINANLLIQLRQRYAHRE